MHELADQILSYLKGAWQYRWYAAVLAWLIAIAGWIFVYQLPNRYEATARVYVDTQSVLRPLLAGVAVQPNVDQLLTMMSRTLISRPNLEKVIQMADLDIKVNTPEDREKLVSRLTKDLSIKSAGRDNLYIISYHDVKPQEARRVVQSLLTIFVEGSIGDKRKDSDSARRFIDEQLAIYSEKLNAAEKAVAEFKRRHIGLMGTEGRNYYTRMAEAQTVLSQARLDFKEAENSRDAIKSQLTGAEEIPKPLGEVESSEIAAPEIDNRIRDLEKQLDGLRLRFTDKHPDVIATTRMIEQLREQKQKEAKAKKPAAGRIQTHNPVVQQLSIALAESEASVASKRARVAEYERRLEALKAAAHSIPQMDAEFTQLTRDYEVTKKNYENLLARRESAEISGNMEATTKVMDFRVIDPPQVPSVPYAPNRPLLMSAVLIGALGAGVGLAFLMSQLRPTLRNERRLREVSGLPVFGTVVMAWTEAQIAKRKRALIAFLFSILGLLSAYAGIMAMLMFTAART